MQQSSPSITNQIIGPQFNQIQQKLKYYESSLQAKNKQVPIQQVKATFSRQIDNFYCDFVLTQKDQLKIVITSQLDASVFELSLLKQQKKEHEELNFFESIEEIYEYVMQNTGQNIKKQEKKLISIKQNGAIELLVVSTIGKKQRHRSILLQTTKVEEKREYYLQKVIKKISKNMIQLKNSYEEIKIKQNMFQKQNNEIMQKLSSYGSRLHWKVDKLDPHFQKFKLLDNRLTKMHDNTTYFNIFSQNTINKTGISYFDVKVISSAKMNIMIGIGSKFIKGIQNAYTHPDLIGFYLYGQTHIWQNNNQRDLQLKHFLIQNGITVTTCVNMDLGYVNWEICGVRVAYVVIPLQLKAKMLFPTIIMINVNDVVQLI